MINKYLIALACGDSYGNYYEYEGLCGIKFDIKKLPNVPKEICITDDTKMATILLKHYFKNKTLHENKLFQEYIKWAKESGIEDGIGIHTEQVLLHNKKNKDSQGNGALMRNIPFGLQIIEDGYSFEEAVDLMNKDSFLTHKNDVIAQTNRLALDLALNGIEVLKKEEYKTLFLSLKKGDTAWVMHSLFIVIEALKQDLNYLDGFKYITSFGGDTDTNCAIFAAIRSYRYDIEKELNIEEFIDIKFIDSKKSQT